MHDLASQGFTTTISNQSNVMLKYMSKLKVTSISFWSPTCRYPGGVYFLEWNGINPEYSGSV